MKTPDRIVEYKHQESPYGDPAPGYGSTFAVDEDLAAQLPELALPTMSDAGRKAFRALLAYETRAGSDMFKLVEARGYTAHPCDYVPEFRWQYAGHHPKVYQPWTDWLSDNGITRFHRGNTLTPENCRHFSPDQRRWAFKDLVRRNDPEKLDYAIKIIEAQPAEARAKLLNEVDAGGSFWGIYPWQAPVIERFLDDRAASVRATAKSLLARGGGQMTVEHYARIIAEHFSVSEDTVGFRKPPENAAGFLYREFACVTFDALAEALGLSSVELAERIDFDNSGNVWFAVRSAGVEERSIMARRMLDQGKGAESIPIFWFGDAVPDLWQRGYEAVKLSPYINSLEDFPGFVMGSIGVDELLAWREWEFMRGSVTRELETGHLPVNIQYDPLRYLGKFVDKEAAQAIIDEAISLGMSPDHPRLTMLRLNLAL